MQFRHSSYSRFLYSAIHTIKQAGYISNILRAGIYGNIFYCSLISYFIYHRDYGGFISYATMYIFYLQRLS